VLRAGVLGEVEDAAARARALTARVVAVSAIFTRLLAVVADERLWALPVALRAVFGFFAAMSIASLSLRPPRPLAFGFAKKGA
ncbi:MAG: hypothetical protein OXS50_13270, partial [Gammaproteobacteria bacterium]|nr:hypothetical protein [Gammaproteobacteria bacterium]